MQLDEIKEQLKEWFPAEAHKERKLPGGGKWFYIPHQLIVTRLNEICFGYWHDDYKPPIISGDYLTVYCQLTICGVTRTGVADSKTYPELNEDGKEKIIGSPAVNTSRHAFRDAAEKFGVGAYLDSQKGKGRDAFVKYMTGRGDGRAAKFAQENEWIQAGVMGKPKAQAPTAKQKSYPNKRENIDPRQDRRNHESIPVPPGAVGLYPQHRQIIERVRSLTGHTSKQIEDWCAAKGKQGSADLDLELVQELASDLALGWGESRFPSPELAEKSYSGKIATLTASGMDLAGAIASWMESVELAKV